ncbi:MAG: DUF4432 family protein [Christensenellales bacterium]|jgi:hypothetical protein
MQQFDMRYVGHPAQVGGVTRFIYVGGRADGIRAARVNTGGGLEYTVLESRSMDLYDLSFGGVNCAFIAKPGLVHPAYFSAMEGEFLRFFPAGMLYTCGLLNIGQPRRGAFETMPQHGRIAATPAEEFSAGVDRESGRIVLEGVMRQAALFHDRLTLRRRIVSEMGGASLHIEDTVTNEGYEPADIRLLYHFNFGWPLLAEDACLAIDSQSVEPSTPDARRGLGRWDRFEEPSSPRAEEVFFHAPRPDTRGLAHAQLVRESLGIGMRLSWQTDTLPHMIEWKSMQSGDYVLGLEPATLRFDRADEPGAPLAPGAQRVFSMTLEAFRCRSGRA